MTTEIAGGRPTEAAGHQAAMRAGDPRLAPWRTFLHAHARLTRRLDEELRAAHGLSLAEYDALVQLAGAPGRRLRMSALADRVLLSRSGITRLVDRLVADGMVERSTCTTDARGAEAGLTRHGLDRLREASRTHLDGVRHYFLDTVSPSDQAALERGLGRVMDGLGCDPAGTGAGPRAAADPDVLVEHAGAHPDHEA
jgi:DNA-binding MarR family transcriptional regulator